MDRHVSEEDMIGIDQFLNERNNIRAIEYITSHYRDVVMRVTKSLAMHAEIFTWADGCKERAGKCCITQWYYFILLNFIDPLPCKQTPAMI